MDSLHPAGRVERRRNFGAANRRLIRDGGQRPLARLI